MSRSSERATDERLVVALVRGVHGLHGAVRVEVLTDRPDDRFVPGAVLFREGEPRPLTHRRAREAVADGPGWRLRFREIATRDGADTLRGAYLEAAVRPDGDLARGAYYWHEVIGATVRGVDGAELGTVQDIYRVAENEVFVVERRAVRELRPAGGPRLHPDLRAAPGRDRGRRRRARPAPTARSRRPTRIDRGRRGDGHATRRSPAPGQAATGDTGDPPGTPA